MHLTPSVFFSRFLIREALVYNSYFFFRTAILRKWFDIRFLCKGRDPFNQTSNRSDREKWSSSKGGPVFSKLFQLDRTDPLSFGPKFWKFWLNGSCLNTVISHAFAYSSRWHRKPWQGLFHLVTVEIFVSYWFDKLKLNSVIESKKGEGKNSLARSWTPDLLHVKSSPSLLCHVSKC